MAYQGYNAGALAGGTRRARQTQPDDQQGGAGQDSPAASPGAAAPPLQRPTFSDLQRQGRARPAPPAAPAPSGVQPAPPSAPMYMTQGARGRVTADTEVGDPSSSSPPGTQPPAAQPSTTQAPATGNGGVNQGGNTPVSVGGGGSPQTGGSEPPPAPAQKQWVPGENPFVAPGGTNVLQYLWQQFQGANPNGEPFTQGAWSPTTAPSYSPNGVQTMMAPGQAPATPDAFAPGQYQGPGYSPVTAPDAQNIGAFAGGSSAVQPQLQSAIMAALGQPSAYGSDQVMSSYNQLSGRIDDDYSLQQKQLQETLAARGLGTIDDGTIGLGKLSDLNIAKRDAKTTLASDLLDKQAQTYGSDRAAAIAQAMGFDQSQFGNALAGYQANAGASNQNFQNQLAQAAFQGDQNAQQVLQSLNIAGFNQGAGQAGFNNALSAYQAQLAGQGQNFGQQLQANQFNLGAANQDFGNQLAGAQFGAGQQQQGFANALAAYQANQAAQQQGFGQQQQWLQNYLGAGQQSFQNDLATNAANQQGLDGMTSYLLSLFGGLN